MHPHIPRPRRKATRTCTDTASVVRTVHGEFMWPFTARVNEKTAPIERITAVAICRRLRDAQPDLCSTVNGQRAPCGHSASQDLPRQQAKQDALRSLGVGEPPRCTRDLRALPEI